MGRRPLTTERRRQIIATVIQCMATQGVAGTTLERIADATGMARGHIRHYAGNRDDLLTDAARVFYFGDDTMDQKNLTEVARTNPILDPRATVDEAVDYLFGEFSEPGADNAAAFAFVDAGRTNPAIHAIVLAAYLGMQDSLIEIVSRAYPAAPAHACRQTAYALLTLAIGHNFITDIETSAERIEDVRATAFDLIAALRARE